MNSILNTTGHKIEIPDMVQADGVFLKDNSGKRYIDLESGVWCTSLGHNNEEINWTIVNQLEKISHSGFCYSNHVVERGAEEVLKITGFESGKCVFLSSGSEAIEFGRQVAKKITGRRKSMTLHDSYLGSYSSVIERDKDWYIFDWSKCDKCQSCSSTCKLIENIPDDISEFIFEPGSSSGFVRFPPVPLIEQIVEKVRQNGGKILINEVTTGIGRTGKWFGFNHYPIEPDMVAMGKGIGNGYPVSVTALNKRTAEEIESTDFKYSQSHQNDPLGAAVVSKVIRIIEKNKLIERAEKLGRRFYENLKELEDRETILNVRGRGLMIGIDFANEEYAYGIFKKLLDKGYIVGFRKTLFRIDPPLTVDEEILDCFIEEFKRNLCYALKF